MDIEIKKVGDKLKTLRKSLGLRQEELVKHKVAGTSKETPFTRNLVSMVETDKSPLTAKLADTIHKNLLIVCKERGIPCDFDFDEVCLTPQDQTKRYIKNYENEMCKVISFEESIKYAEKLIVLAEEYRLFKELSGLYITLGDLCENRDKELSTRYYLKALVLKSEITEKEGMELTRKLKYIYILDGKYHAALNVHYSKTTGEKEILKKCMFNDILCFNKLKMDKETVEGIKDLKAILDKKIDKDILFKIQMIEAVIYEKNNDLMNSLKIYNDLLNRSKSTINTNRINCNILKLKIEAGICTIEDIKQVENSAVIEDLGFSERIIYYRILAKAYTSLEMEKSIRYLITAIDSIINREEVNSESKKYFNLIIGGILDDDKKLEVFKAAYDNDFKMFVVTLIKRDLLNENTMLKVLRYFQKNKDYDFVTNLIDKRIS